MISHRRLGQARLALILSVTFATCAFAEDGVTKDQVLLGQSAGLTGQTEGPVRSMVNGAKMVFDKVNAAGGVNGRKIKVLQYDDEYDPARAVGNVKKLIEQDKVFCLFNNYGNAPNKAIMGLVEKDYIPLITPSASGEEFRVPVQKNIFLLRQSSKHELGEVIQYAVKKLGLKRIGVLFQSDRPSRRFAST